MDRHFCFFVFFSVFSFNCFASLINEHEITMLASHLSDEECRKCILVLYKKLAYELVQSNQYTGDCDRDLRRWLRGKADEKDSLVLEELQNALFVLGRPALAQQLSMEVYKETDYHLEDFFDTGALLLNKEKDSDDRHCFAKINRKLVILVGQLSDEECRELLIDLYKKPAYMLAQHDQYTGLCYNDLTKWLLDREDDIPVLKELHMALVKLNRPALGQQMLIEVYKETRDL